MSEIETVVLRVKAGSDARKVGSAVAHSVFEKKNVVLRAVGAGAVNQAAKAVAIANGWTGPRGERLAMIPGFADVEGRDGGTISALAFQVITL